MNRPMMNIPTAIFRSKGEPFAMVKDSWTAENVVSPIVKTIRPTPVSMNIAATAESSKYRKAPSTAKIPRSIAIKINDAIAVTSRNT